MSEERDRGAVTARLAIHGLDRLTPEEEALAGKIAAGLEAIGVFEQDGPEPAHLLALPERDRP